MRHPPALLFKRRAQELEGLTTPGDRLWNDQVLDATRTSAAELRGDPASSAPDSRPVVPLAVMGEVERYPAEPEQLIITVADNEHGLVIRQEAVQESPDRRHQRILRSFVVASPIARAERRNGHLRGDGACAEVVEQARVWTMGDQPISRLKMPDQVVVVAQPPEVRAREQEVVGARRPELLQMRDRVRCVGWMVPRVSPVRRLREVPTLDGVELDQALIALAHHSHRRAWVDQAAHQPVDPVAHVPVVGPRVAREPAAGMLLRESGAAVDRVQVFAPIRGAPRTNEDTRQVAGLRNSAVSCLISVARPGLKSISSSSGPKTSLTYCSGWKVVQALLP